ncbi:hypothetical protein D3C71_1614310 [compost metagenome]
MHWRRRRSSPCMPRVPSTCVCRSSTARWASRTPRTTTRASASVPRPFPSPPCPKATACTGWCSSPRMARSPRRSRPGPLRTPRPRACPCSCTPCAGAWKSPCAPCSMLAWTWPPACPGPPRRPARSPGMAAAGAKPCWPRCWRCQAQTLWHCRAPWPWCRPCARIPNCSSGCLPRKAWT